MTSTIDHRPSTIDPRCGAAISAVLIVLDGERHLDRVLAALGWCDEILILDSGSTDRTREIAAAHGARVEHQPFLGYGAQKQRAIDLARHDWVLLVDDDEVLDEPAARAIAGLDLGDPARCWRLRRRTYVGAREVRHGVFGDERTLRLFNRTRSAMAPSAVHESVRAGGPVGDLPGALHHYSFIDEADLFARMAGYARLKAQRYRTEGRRSGAPLLALRFAWAFIRGYVLARGFLDGRLGLIVALSAACDAVLGLAQASSDG